MNIPETWGTGDIEADAQIYRLIVLSYKSFIRKNGWDYSINAIVRTFQKYENMYTCKRVKVLMRKNVAFNIFFFVCNMAEPRGITEDIVEGLWKQVFRREIWQFTGSYSPCSKKQELSTKT